MEPLFNRILIPVDFSVNTEIAIKKAIGFIERKKGKILLLHVVPRPMSWKSLIGSPARSPTSADGKYDLRDAEKKMQQWKSTIEDTLPGITVYTSISTKRSVQDNIIDSARSFTPDLIIIGKKGNLQPFPFFRAVSPAYIARITNCPVLTAKPGSIQGRIKIIVIPIQDSVPQRKLELALMIAKQFRAQVHLIIFSGKTRLYDKTSSQAFILSYHQLRDALHHPIEYSSSTTHNMARATLSYAESIKADIILANPQTESGFLSITGTRHISDLLMRNSRIQVLDVLPYGRTLQSH